MTNQTKTTDETQPTPDPTPSPRGESPQSAAPVEPTPDDTASADEDKAGPNAEAAKYRRRLREAETERDQLQAQVTALQRSAVEALAVEMKLKPEALWAAGVEVTELVNDDGTLDRAKSSAAIQAAGDKLGIWESRKKIIVPREGESPSGPRHAGFTEAFRAQQ